MSPLSDMKTTLLHFSLLLSTHRPTDVRETSPHYPRASDERAGAEDRPCDQDSSIQALPPLPLQGPVRYTFKVSVPSGRVCSHALTATSAAGTSPNHNVSTLEAFTAGALAVML